METIYSYNSPPKVYLNRLLCKYDNIEIYKIVIFAPLIAKHYLPGQFVILMVNEKSERIPLTIVETDIQQGTITLIYQVVGFTTKLLSNVKEGEALFHIVGPLGKPACVEEYKSNKIVFVAGGVGAAEVYPLTHAFKKNNNFIITILGAKSKSLLILEEEFKKVSNCLYVTTDDGSYGIKGFVTDALKEILNDHKNINLVYAVGPLIMMQNVAILTKEYNIKTIASLNTIMIDGTGMCGSCRVTCDKKIKYVCCDGPEFDAHSIDWDEVIARNNAYLTQEKEILNTIL